MRLTGFNAYRRSEQNVELLYSRLKQFAYRDEEKRVLENPCHWQHVAEAGLFYIVSTIHIWDPYFCSIGIFVLHIWRLIGLIAFCVHAGAGT